MADPKNENFFLFSPCLNTGLRLPQLVTWWHFPPVKKTGIVPMLALVDVGRGKERKKRGNKHKVCKSEGEGEKNKKVRHKVETLSHYRAK